MNTSISSEPVYCVSSFHRSGSSMMMRCLAESSKLPVEVEWNFDATAMGHPADYHPNPNGFYQASDMDTDFPYFYDTRKGMLIKIVRAALLLLPKGNYKLIFMTRNPDEILASMKRWTPWQHWGSAERNVYLYDQVLQGTLDHLRVRGDFEVLQVHYNDVVKNPTPEFQRIKDFGFPIDVTKAASLVDASLYRLRLEK